MSEKTFRDFLTISVGPATALRSERIAAHVLRELDMNITGTGYVVPTSAYGDADATDAEMAAVFAAMLDPACKYSPPVDGAKCRWMLNRSQAVADPDGPFVVDHTGIEMQTILQCLLIRCPAHCRTWAFLKAVERQLRGYLHDPAPLVSLTDLAARIAKGE